MKNNRLIINYFHTHKLFYVCSHLDNSIKFYLMQKYDHFLSKLEDY